MAVNGFDTTATGIALAKQILMECNGTGDVTLPKETVRAVLGAFLQAWQAQQDRTRSEFKKAAV